MKNNWFITGRVISGAQKASYFTNIPWVQEQCLEKLGFRPYPGTLNIEVCEGSSRALLELRKRKGIVLNSPDEETCSASALPARVELLECAIIIPPESVNIHGRNILEILAPVKLKDALGVRDGDILTVLVDLAN